MERIVKILICFVTVFILKNFAFSEVTVKVKDISYINGLKENQVLGYGLVVGLQGTGDTKSSVTKSTLKNLLKNLGLGNGESFSKNCAAVLLTAQLPPFVRIGDRIDITVSSIGDAKSLEGGILIQSPLKGADDRVYAVVQGPLSVLSSGVNNRGIKTVAVITGGGVIEREIIPTVVVKNSIFIVLKKWDYSVASTIIKSIAKKYPASKPVMVKGKIRVLVQKNISLPEFISSIQDIEVNPGVRARVVVNERDGTIVTGGNVKISEAIVSMEGITVEIGNTGERAAVSHLKETSSVKDLVDALNSIGSSTKDIISILKALNDAGALHAELVVK